LIAGRDLDAHGRIAAAQGRALARQVDNLAASRSGSAALGLAAVSRRLDDIIVSLHVRPADAVTEIVEARRARLASLGIPVAGDGGASSNLVMAGANSTLAGSEAQARREMPEGGAAAPPPGQSPPPEPSAVRSSCKTRERCSAR
jgi:hypothetical protein